MRAPPHFSTLPRGAQLQLALLGPLLFGMVCGFLLESNAPAYWILSTVGLLGAVSGGMEHSGARAGTVRGLLAGVLFGAGVLLAHALDHDPPLARIPHPAALLLPLSAVIGALFGAAGGALRERLERTPN